MKKIKAYKKGLYSKNDIIKDMNYLVKISVCRGFVSEYSNLICTLSTIKINKNIKTKLHFSFK